MVQSLLVHRISKKIADKKLYEVFSYCFKTGVYAIVGPNGVGKTVFLKILAGLLPVDDGYVELQGVGRCDEMSYKKRLLYIPSYPKFFPFARSADMVEFMMSARRVENKKQMYNVLCELKLLPYLNMPFQELSLGTQKKFFIAMLADNRESVVLLDEPTNALDQPSLLYLSFLIQSLAKKSIVIFVSHDEEFVKSSKAHVLALKDSPSTMFESNLSCIF